MSEGAQALLGIRVDVFGVASLRWHRQGKRLLIEGLLFSTPPCQPRRCGQPVSFYRWETGALGGQGTCSGSCSCSVAQLGIGHTAGGLPDLRLCEGACPWEKRAGGEVVPGTNVVGQRGVCSQVPEPSSAGGQSLRCSL